MPELRTRDGYQLKYDVEGTGTPLVLLHGWAMSGRVWRYQVERFATTHRVVIPNLRGHGGSPPPASGPTVDECAGDLAELLEALDLNGATLVAWSMGGTVALRACSALRHRLAGLVLVGATPRFTAGDGYPHGLPPEEARGMALRLKRGYIRTLEEFFRGMFAPGEVSGETYRKIAGDIVTGAPLPDAGVVIRALASLACADMREYLPSLDLPVLLIHGAEDRICLADASRYMAEKIPAAHAEILPGRGHAPFLTAPALFNDLIRQFQENIHAR